MSDLEFQNISTVQNNQQVFPGTIASAATIAPQNFLTVVSGTVAVQNIIPPVTGVHLLALVFNNAAPAVMLTTGNIQSAVAPAQNVPVFLVYNPVAKKYYGGGVKVT